MTAQNARTPEKPSAARRAPRPLRTASRLIAAAALLLLCGTGTGARADGPIRLKVVGGLDRVSQYVRYEEPFWRERVPLLTGGRVQAEIRPADSSGLRMQEMLQLMRLGVVPFGTAILSVASADEPELNAVDLPALNPDMASLRRTAAAYRPHLRQVLQARYGVELLGIYVYPAQVVHCAQPFGGLRDLAGRRVRTSSVGQSEMVAALGAKPVITAFGEIVGALRGGRVDCAVTGTLTGNEVGIAEVTSHVHALAISWGVSFFGANAAAWEALPLDLREALRGGIAELERDIWDAADKETAEGLACDTGASACRGGRRGRMVLVPVSAEDEAERARLLARSVVPSWVQRCGTDCERTWNGTLAPALGLPPSAE